ncbi:hypothetical protein [Haliovirga abyssi]|uniref:Lipoprotein n=1 Tax=Haliovirga abyssi TaxID=2996794 RepID=A0AAU9DMF2_9FUSO|nr:hypothetical protein [Haliovirga abyssi]BDU51192.1 hypothetical protein HLVA_17610 [Haliovirga abyssi]
MKKLLLLLFLNILIIGCANLTYKNSNTELPYKKEVNNLQLKSEINKIKLSWNVEKDESLDHIEVYMKRSVGVKFKKIKKLESNNKI